MDDYVVAVPSYGRYQQLGEKTLKCLKDGGVPTKRVYVFVANEEEKLKYEEAVPKDLYGHMVVGVKGLREQRNFIGDYFAEGRYIVQLDDDVVSFQRLDLPENVKKDMKAKLKPITDLPKLFKVGFDECKENNYHLWGIYPVANAGFMKNEVSKGLVFCPGWAWGVINRKIPLKLTYKEDYERSLQNAIVDGGCIRLDAVCAKTKQYAKGGLSKTQEERIPENKASSDFLMKQYPNLGIRIRAMKDPKFAGTEISFPPRVKPIPEDKRKSLAEVKGGRQPAATPSVAPKSVEKKEEEDDEETSETRPEWQRASSKGVKFCPLDSEGRLKKDEKTGSGGKPDGLLTFDEFKKKYFTDTSAKAKTNRRLSKEVKEKLKDASEDEKTQYITKLWKDIKDAYDEEKKTRKTTQSELKDAPIDDKENANVCYVPIRNSKKYEETRDALLEALRTDSKKLPGVASRTKVIGKDAGTTAEGGKKTEAETITFGFGSIQGKGHGFFATNTKYRKIYEACIAFGNQCVPKGWKYNAITLNHNTQTKVHIDGYNVGRSVIVGIGDYTGGNIRVWERPDEEFYKEGKEAAKKGARKSANQMLKEGNLSAKFDSKSLNIKNRPLMFNGGILPHATETFVGNGEKGKGRYTLIFYSHTKLPPNNEEIGIGSGMRGKGLPQPEDPPMV